MGLFRSRCRAGVISVEKLLNSVLKLGVHGVVELRILGADKKIIPVGGNSINATALVYADDWTIDETFAEPLQAAVQAPWNHNMINRILNLNSVFLMV